MSEEAVANAVDAVCNHLTAALGDQLSALYLHGSLAEGSYRPDQSDVNLMLVVTPTTGTHDVRAAWGPIWEEYGSLLRRGPGLATPQSLERLVFLDPNWGYRLLQRGRLLAGNPVTDIAPQVDDRRDLARRCLEALDASTALAPQLLPAELAAAVGANLRALARREGIVEESANPVALFAAVQAQLSAALSAAGEPLWTAKSLDDAPPLLPGLVAIYERADQIVLVLPDGDPGQWTAIEWPAVAELVAGDYGAMGVTSATQLRLVATVADPLAIALRNFNHAWGHDPLGDLAPDLTAVVHRAALAPAWIQLADLPAAYLTAGDEDLHRIVHDFQNKLLNIQLQHELLHRLYGLPRAGPPEALPGREAPLTTRVAAIDEHLAWWAAYYTARYVAASQPA